MDNAAYVRGQIESLTESLTRVMFGDFTAVAETQEPDEAFGYLCVMINAAINAARNAHEELRDANERLSEANKRLQRTIAGQRESQEEIRKLNENLESLIEERTAELSEARLIAEQASQAKNDFLSRMSHELRTPLNSILGFAQLLGFDHESLSADQQECLAQILKAGGHLLDLINEVLDIARIEAGQLNLSLEPNPVIDIVHDTVKLVGPLAHQHGIRIDADTKSDVEWLVLADRQRLRQILLNLLTNAIKYNRQDGIADVRCEILGDDRLRILVTDTGPGLSPEQQSRLFIPFERLGADSSGVEGTGVGLALCQRLATAMGGSLGVASALGHGSTFWVELALAHDEALTPIQVGHALTGPVPPTPHGEHRITVLYIEDNLANLRLVERILARRSGIDLLVATQGRTGIDLAIEHRPDLVLLDLHLPDIPGGEVLRHLWADERTRTIPVAVFSADATPGQIRRLLETGARAYLTKPLDVQQLLKLLDDVSQAR